MALPVHKHVGPLGGDEPVRVGIFAGLHGDEPAGSYAAVHFLRLLRQVPALACGYEVYVYPLCNPFGFLQGTRHCASGLDLNREFWRNSQAPEVVWLQNELLTRRFNGIVALHSDDTSPGLYGFVRGATLSRELLEPALAAAEKVLPRNRATVIDGFPAENGIIGQGYEGILSCPPGLNPEPFELILETPALAPIEVQEKAFVLALEAVLIEYQRVISYAANL